MGIRKKSQNSPSRSPSHVTTRRGIGVFFTYSIPVMLLFVIVVCISAQKVLTPHSTQGVASVYHASRPSLTSINNDKTNLSIKRRILNPSGTMLIRLSRFHNKGDYKAISMGRTVDKALNYLKRKEGFIKANFTVKGMRFSHWGRAHGMFKRDWERFDPADAYLCLSKTYCFDEELYAKIENTGARMDRIYGQLESWTNKQFFCSTLRDALRPWTKVGVSYMRKFTFECWIFPRHHDEFRGYLNQPNYFDFANGWVFKLSSKGGGAGVYYKPTKEDVEEEVERLEELNKTFVIQPRLASPLLINNHKFDLRCHVLVTSVSPMRIYLHTNGIVRFAGNDYGKGSKKSFLTNMSVNNKGKTKSEDLAWSHKHFREYLKDDGEVIFSRIQTAIAQMLVATESSFNKIYSNVENGAGFKCRTCYQQLGIDILVNDDLQPHILEVNGNPMQNFKDEKISELCEDFQEDITKLLYGKYPEEFKEDLVSSLDSIKPDNVEFDDYYSWLDDDHIEYLLRLQTEKANDLGFYRIYPPQRATHSKETQEDWNHYLSHLGFSKQRIAFHNLLVELQR